MLGVEWGDVLKKRIGCTTVIQYSCLLRLFATFYVRPAHSGDASGNDVETHAREENKRKYFFVDYRDAAFELHLLERPQPTRLDVSNERERRAKHGKATVEELVRLLLAHRRLVRLFDFPESRLGALLG